MNGLDTLMTVSDQVMLLPDQYLRQGITILRSVIYLARLEEEGRREQALLVRQAMEANGALVTQSAAVSAPATQPSWSQTSPGRKTSAPVTRTASTSRQARRVASSPPLKRSSITCSTPTSPSASLCWKCARP